MMRRGFLASPRIPLAIAVLAAAGIAVSRMVREGDGEAHDHWTVGIAGIAAILLLFWAIVLSGLRRRTRLAILAVILASAGLFGVLFRLRGFTGDVVPIFEFRFGRRIPRIEAPPAEGPATAAPVAAKTDGLAWKEWPGFFGPERDGVVRGVRLGRDWTSRPPRLLWKIGVGEGWSGFAVSGDAAFTLEQCGEKEAVTCYGLLDGRPRWERSVEARFAAVLGGVGPRSTPTVSGGRVFALGATGLLRCLDAATGWEVWTRDILGENGAKSAEWGVAGSPLVIGDRVIVSAGGPRGRSLVAYSAADGAPVWGGGDDPAGYASPRLATIAGAPQVLILNKNSLAAHDPATGAVLWRFPWQDRHPNCAQPRPLPGDRVLFSTGYDVGSALLEVVRDPAGGFSAREVWRSRSLKAKFAAFVDRDGFVYGLDDGILTCIDIETGGRKWKGGRYGHGQLLLVEDLLLISTEGGEVVLVEAAPGEHREVARFQAVDGKTWNVPALAAPYLLVRNDAEAACYELAIEPR
jgi:outer membrane protein assembly factor BamB